MEFPQSAPAALQRITDAGRRRQSRLTAACRCEREVHDIVPTLKYQSTRAARAHRRCDGRHAGHRREPIAYHQVSAVDQRPMRAFCQQRSSLPPDKDFARPKTFMFYGGYGVRTQWRRPVAVAIEVEPCESHHRSRREMQCHECWPAPSIDVCGAVSRLPLKGREENALSSLPLVTADAGPSERSEPDGCEASGDVVLTRAPPS